jgi:zinc transport system substrate-binding protein
MKRRNRNKNEEKLANKIYSTDNHYNSRKITKHLELCLMLLLMLFAPSCSNKEYKQRTITVTIEPLKYFTEQIAGDKFKVVSMVPKGGSPETYEPSPRQMADLSESDLYILAGQIDFERTWMNKLKNYAPHTIIIDSSKGINYIRTINGEQDPHIWMSTINAKTIATNIYNALVLVDSKDRMTFKHNLEALMTKIENTDTQIRENLTKDKSTTFLIYHPALTYYANDYNLTQIPIEREGREPSAAQIKQLTLLAKQKKVKTMFIQKQFSVRNADVVNRSVNAKTVLINPLSYHWDIEMVDIAKKLR